MDLKALRNHCLAKKVVPEELPFGPTTLVFKVVNKVFALTGLEDDELRINLKCNPERALDLRDHGLE